MIGDGITIARHCENVDLPLDREPDAPPLSCEGTTTASIDSCNMAYAQRIAMMSDDTTKIGAVIMDTHLNILSRGYNHFPKGVQRTEERSGRPAKYDYTEHAERDAIFAAARRGVALEGSIMYVSGLRPCKECARAIVLAGIKTLVLESLDIPEAKDGHSWAESMRIGAQILEEGGVTVQLVN